MNNKKMKRYLDLLKSNGFQFKNKNFYGKEGQFLEYLVVSCQQTTLFNLWKKFYVNDKQWLVTDLLKL